MRRTGSPISRGILPVLIMTQLLVNFWSKLYSKSLFPNEWNPCLYLTRGSHARSNRAPVFQSIVSINLIKIMVFIKLLKSIVSIFLSVSINQRLVPHLISLGRVYIHVQNDIHMGWWPRPPPS